MEVKELAEKIKELNIDSCTSCPFKRDYCELHGVACIDVNENLGFAESLLQLEHFFETGAIKKYWRKRKMIKVETVETTESGTKVEMKGTMMDLKADTVQIVDALAIAISEKSEISEEIIRETILYGITDCWRKKGEK